MSDGNKGVPARLDPRSCLVCAGLFSIVAACLDDLSAALAALAISFCVLPLAWRGSVHLGKRLLAVNLFVLFIWLVTPFSTPGASIWHLGFLDCTREGIKLALLVSIKANALVIVFMSLVTPLPLASMGSALRALRCPDKLTWLFLLMDRNIALLKEEWRRLMEAARLRCFRPGNNLNTYRTIGSLLGLFLIRACERSRILHEAMLLKGYNGKLPFCEELSFHCRDYILWLGCLSAISILLFLESGTPHVRF